MDYDLKLETRKCFRKKPSSSVVLFYLAINSLVTSHETQGTLLHTLVLGKPRPMFTGFAKFSI